MIRTITGIFYNHRIIPVAIRSGQNLTIQLTIPPDAFFWLVNTSLINDITFAIIYIAHSRPHFITFVVFVNIYTLTTTHISNTGQIPFLNGFTITCIIHNLTKHVRSILLNSESFQSGS